MFLTFQMNDREEKMVSDPANGVDRTAQQSDGSKASQRDWLGWD